ncbi:MAG TPA: putative toxin-antitoxin system toxin component, PIN family [Stellaceae bacterium]|nr:putative toxin-antitoxin system toxin component, PIN family [Stellaceae bacterium]
MVDTNVFISAGIKASSVPGVAVYLVVEGHVLLKSTPTEQELFGTLARPRLAPLIPSAFRSWLFDVFAKAEFVAAAECIFACRDPRDDKFLELAVDGQADLIISGDKDLLDLDPFGGIPIVSAAAFVQSAQQ